MLHTHADNVCANFTLHPPQTLNSTTFNLGYSVKAMATEKETLER